MKKNKWLYVCLVIVLFALLVSACSREKEKEVVPPPTVEEGDKTTETEVPPVEKTPEGEAPKETEETPPTAEVTAPAKTQTESSKPFWQSESTRQTNNLIAIAGAGQTDYKATGAKRGWMSKNGKLYSNEEGRYITTDLLVAEGYLETGLAADAYEILLIKGSDLAEIEGATVPKESMDFGVFAATKQSGKYLLASPQGKAGQISESGYEQLLSKYNQSHGKIVRLSSGAAEYFRILNYISLFEGRLDDYFVREIRRDDKYAVVVFSSRSDVTNIKQYILQNDNNFWEVVVPNVQSQYYPVTTINSHVPDFNMELLPSYNVSAWIGKIQKQQGGAEAALFSGRFIESTAEIWYQCATANAAYVVLMNGERYACYKENGAWKATLVDSDIAGKKLLQEKTNVDYGFLILDD